MSESEQAPNSFDAKANAELLRLNDQQLAWCMATLKGANKSAAAKTAGYQGTPEQLRSIGSKVSRSKKVMRFLELATIEGGSSQDKPMDAAERRRRLSKLARSGDGSTMIRASELLHKMDEAEADRDATTPPDINPLDVLAELAEADPMLAVYVSAAYTINLKLTPEQEKQIADAHCDMAWEWIRVRPAEAAAYAQQWLPPTRLTRLRRWHSF